VALPFAAAHPVAKSARLVEHGMDRWNYILTIDDNRFTLGRAQCDVQNRSLFGDVDLLSPEHSVDAFAQAGFFRQLHQQL
jgi:hypothetical protein